MSNIDPHGTYAWYEEACIKRAAQFHQLPETSDLAEIMLADKDGFNQAMSNVQRFLKDSNYLLIAKADQKTSLERAVEEATGCSGFQIRIGLVSVFDLSGYWGQDHSQLFYRFWIGDVAKWNEHIHETRSKNEYNLTSDFSSIEKKLLESGVPLGTRIFRNKNASGALLSLESTDVFHEKNRVLIPYEPSKEGAGRISCLLTEHPWALVNSEKAFPQLYALAKAYGKPVGFLQCAITLPDAWSDKAKFAYDGRERGWLNIYSPNAGWVKHVVRLTSIYSSVFLPRVLSAINSLLTAHAHFREQRVYFPLKFLKQLGLDREANPRSDMYKESRWGDSIGEMHACLNGYSRNLVDRWKGKREAFREGIIIEWFSWMLKTFGRSWLSPLRAGLRSAPLRCAGPRF